MPRTLTRRAKATAPWLTGEKYIGGPSPRPARRWGGAPQNPCPWSVSDFSSFIPSEKQAPMLRNFDELLAEEIASQDGAADARLVQAPALYRLLTQLLGDPALPARLRPLLLAGIGYFVVPDDIQAEDLRGVPGFADDIFLAAWIA